MSAAPIPLHGCKHAEVDVEALLADDRIAAAVNAPVVPGTTERDIQRWMACVYRHIAGVEANSAAVCALLQQRSPNMEHPCVIAKTIWKNTEEYAPIISKVSEWLADPNTKLPQEAFSDIGNARRLAVLSGTDIAHDAGAGWRVWADSAWINDPEGAVVQRAAKDVSRMLQAEADALMRQFHAATNEAEQERIEDRWKPTAKAAIGAQDGRSIGRMTKLVRDEPGVLTRPEQWDANPRLLACPGATIELTDKGHAWRVPRRADRLTKLTVGRPGTGTKGPNLKKFLRTAQPDHEVRLFVQKLLGYGLVAGNPRRLLVIFLGKTSTGKTTIGEIINHVLGDYAGPFNLSLFRGKMDEGPRSDVIKALGRRMIFASEVSQRWQLHADEVKRLTGGDSVQARDLYVKASATVERRPAFLPILSANHVPTILGADPATRRRLLAVPWENQVDPDQEDPELGERIRTQEADAVLDWLLHGYDLYCKFGLGEPPHAVVQATMKLHDSLTVQDHWLAEHTEQDETYKVTTDDLWAAYREWCADGGIPDDARGNKINFARHLGGLGHKPGWVGRRRGWTGLQLKESEFSGHGP